MRRLITNVVTTTFLLFGFVRYNVTDKEGKRCFWSSHTVRQNMGARVLQHAISTPKGSSAEVFCALLVLFFFFVRKCVCNPAILKHFAIYNNLLSEQQPTEMSHLEIMQCRSELFAAFKDLVTPLGRGKISLHRVS